MRSSGPPDQVEPVRLIESGRLAPLLVEYRKRTDLSVATEWPGTAPVWRATRRAREAGPRSRAIVWVALASFACAWLVMVVPRAADRGPPSAARAPLAPAAVVGLRGAGGSEGSSGSARAPGGGSGAGGA